ncbi:YaiI/YqxD family protein [Curvivirga sp.]|uniref:YaiI/YqxD family protein n=1 Tax=Curvivirga sp. TaxID=2856848 RepID=UPI003B59A89D
MEIYVDGDACPVKQEVIKVAERHKLKVYLVANEWLRLGMHPLAESIVVSEGADAADDWIVDHLQPNDIVITNDIPLADRCLKKGGHVLGAKGKPFDINNIGMAMAMRELKSDLRDMGTIKEGGPAFSKQDRSSFLNALEVMVQTAKRR